MEKKEKMMEEEMGREKKGGYDDDDAAAGHYDDVEYDTVGDVWFRGVPACQRRHQLRLGRQ